MNYIVGTYLAYLAISIAITLWVARTLHRNGRQFLVDSFHGNAALADSVNHLLIVGFYLINIGYVALALKYAAKADNLQEALEAVATKVGSVMLILGGDALPESGRVRQMASARNAASDSPTSASDPSSQGQDPLAIDDGGTVTGLGSRPGNRVGRILILPTPDWDLPPHLGSYPGLCHRPTDRGQGQDAPNRVRNVGSLLPHGAEGPPDWR